VPTSVLRRIYPQYERRIHVEELLPADFYEGRKLKREETYIYEGEGKPVKVVVDCDVFRCRLNGNEVVGVFM